MMTATTAPAPDADAQVAEKKKYYGFSVLVSGLGGLFRSFLPFLLIAVVNAAVQAILIGTMDALPGWTVEFIISLAISAAVLWLSLYFVCRIALQTPISRVSLGSAFKVDGRSLALFTGWVLVLYIVVMALIILYPPLGYLFMIVTPFVALAAADGSANAIGANFRAIGSRFVRYLITILIMSLLLVFYYLLLAFNGFFVSGWLASAITWFVSSLLAAWFLSALAGLYRSTAVGKPEA